MPIDLRDLYKNAPPGLQIDPTSRKGIMDRMMQGGGQFDEREQLAKALDNPESPEQSVGSAGLQDALGSPGLGPSEEELQPPFGQPGPPNIMNGQPVDVEGQMNRQGLGAVNRPMPEAPPPMSGQQSQLPQAVPTPPPPAGSGGAPGASSPLGAPSMPPMMQQAATPSVAPPKPPGGVPGAAPGMQGASGNQPPIPPEAAAAISSASPEQMKNAMSMMQQMWEQEQLKKRMGMGR